MGGDILNLVVKFTKVCNGSTEEVVGVLTQPLT